MPLLLSLTVLLDLRLRLLDELNDLRDRRVFGDEGVADHRRGAAEGEEDAESHRFRVGVGVGGLGWA